MRCPYEPRKGGFEAYFYAGSLEYPVEEKARLAKIFEAVPISTVDMYLDRPGVLIDIAGQAAALIVNYGSSADASLDVIFGNALPEGKPPFDLPRSMGAVEKSMEDVPFSTESPLFRFGHGLRYR